MDSLELTSASAEGDEKEKMLIPSEEDSPPVLNDTLAPLNFCELTPSQFGISVQSFTPASASTRKDKSRLAQIKARRRSTIGVRGSPETNSLIRFIAQQRMKTPPTCQTPEPVRSSPFLPRVASTLRQKMASFQTLMDVEESEACDPMPRQDSNTGGCTIKTRDYLCDENSHDGGKENHPPMMTPTPNKKRRLGPLESCEVEIREASAPILHFSSKEQKEDDKAVTQVVTQGPLPSRQTVKEAQAVLVSPPHHVYFELQASAPPKNQQDAAFELQSPSRTPPDDSAAAAPAHPASSFLFPSLPSLLEMKPTGEDDSTATSTVKKQKKRVRFGGPLSPEVFDKNLPPSTPLQKGATPARAATPGGVLQLRSLLKTPQRSESKTPRAQADLSSPTGFGASPTLRMPHNHRTQFVEEDGEEKNVTIVFPSMEEIDSPKINDTDCTEDTQPLNLNAAFHEESLSQILTEPESKPSTDSQADAVDEPTSVPEREKHLEGSVEAPAPAKSKNRRKKAGPESESTSEAPARSGSRKRKQPEESEPAKRSTRSAAKSASGKMKMNSTATRRWNKDVDRSLYGSRAYASKNPSLSPITERLSFISPSPSAGQTPSTSCTAEKTHSTEVIGDLAGTKASENPSEDSVTSPNLAKESQKGKGRRLSGSRIRGRGLKKRKVSVADDELMIEETQDQIREKTDEHCEDQTTINVEISGEIPLNPAECEQREADAELRAQTSADALSDGKLECHGSPDAPTSDRPPSHEESHDTVSLPLEPTQRKAKRGRRRSVNSSVQQEQQNPAEEQQMSREEEEKGQGDPGASQQELIRASSHFQGGGGEANLDLAPWQADFNFEDIFKPVTTRGQRSVRRSLRNQNNAEHSGDTAGLAWLPRTSPDSNKGTNRRTRGRQRSGAPPVQPPVPEKTEDNAL